MKTTQEQLIEQLKFVPHNAVISISGIGGDTNTRSTNFYITLA